VMIATKAIGRSKMTWLRKDGSAGRQSRAQLTEAVDGSLKRLKTDYIDLYQLHWPDRPMRIFEGLDYVHKEGESHAIESTDVNEYIREISGDDFTAKDFRTWEGTVACAMLLVDRSPIESEAERKRQVAEAMKIVATRLGNTPAVCRACYVHPFIVDAYLENGTLGPFRGGPVKGGLSGEERSVIRLLARLQLAA